MEIAVYDLSDLIVEARRLSTLIDKGVEALRESSREVAEAENAYRHAKARAWVTVEGDLAREREAHVDAATADMRMLRDLAEAKRASALEALRSRRAQLSALQSILNVQRSEIELAR